MTNRKRKRHSASQSFGAKEVRLLDEILRVLMRGGDVRNIVSANRETMALLMRKVQTMKRRIETLHDRERSSDG